MTQDRRVIVIYDARCPVCRRWADFVRRLDVRHRFRLLPADSVQALPFSRDVLEHVHVLSRLAMVTVTPEGVIQTGWDAVTGLLRSYPITWIAGRLGDLHLIRFLGRRVYAWVARRRRRV